MNGAREGKGYERTDEGGGRVGRGGRVRELGEAYVTEGIMAL